MDILIRPATKEDAPAITNLSNQLGYPITEEATWQNLHIILRENNEKIFVAVHENRVIGWTGVIKTIHLTSGPHCELSGLVVDSRYHRKGVGKKLIGQAKRWCSSEGEHLLRVRCNLKRKEAHQFYAHLGFKEVKEQKVFEIDL